MKIPHVHIVSRRDVRDVVLLLQTKRFDEFCVRGSVFALQVLQQTSAFCNLLHQTTTGAKVLAVGFEVLGQLLHFGRQNGDLHLWGTGVRIMSSELFNELFLGGLVEHSLENLADHLSKGSSAPKPRKTEGINEEKRI